MATIEDLLQPRAYAPAPAQPLSLRTTHASWVFLADADVW